MRFSKIKKKCLIKEYDKILYCNKKNNKSYCTLHIGIIVNNNRVMPPTDLILEIRKKYPRCFLRTDNDGHIVLITTIKAVATCSEHDTFDEKKGKTVAYSKAQMKAYDLAKRIYATISLYHTMKHAEFEANWMTMATYYNREVSFLKGM